MVDDRRLPDGMYTPEGVFWADHIKTLKNDPQARLDYALAHRPLPASFREAAIALRALVRERRRNGHDVDDLLDQLYDLAALENLLLAPSALPHDGVQVYDIAAAIPQDVWLQLDFAYSQIGYKRLPLLNATDIKWFTQAWGEPTQHVSARETYAGIWQAAVEGFMEGVRQRQDESWPGAEPRTSIRRHTAGRPWWVWLAGLAAALWLLSLLRGC